MSDARRNTANFLMIPLEPGDSPDNFADKRRRDNPNHIISLSEGLYDLFANADGAYVASAVSGITDLLREPLRVGSGESPQPIQVTFRDDAASLQVTVADPSFVADLNAATARPVQVYAIYVISLDEPRRLPVSQFSISATALTTGASLRNLAPGRYLVLALRQDEMTPWTAEYRNPDVLAQLISKGVVVNLAPSEKESVRVPALAEEQK